MSRPYDAWKAELPIDARELEAEAAGLWDDEPTSVDVDTDEFTAVDANERPTIPVPPFDIAKAWWQAEREAAELRAARERREASQSSDRWGFGTPMALPCDKPTMLPPSGGKE